VRVKKIEVATHPVTGLAGKLKDTHARTDGLYVGVGSWRIEFDGRGPIRFRNDSKVGAVEDRGIFLAACLLLAVTDIRTMRRFSPSLLVITATIAAFVHSAAK
jgi:hypothetical protein